MFRLIRLGEKMRVLGIFVYVRLNIILVRVVEKCVRARFPSFHSKYVCMYYPSIEMTTKSHFRVFYLEFCKFASVIELALEILDKINPFC